MKALTLLTLVSLFLAACAPPPAPGPALIPTPNLTPAASATGAPAATASLTPTASAAPTATASDTPIPGLVALRVGISPYLSNTILLIAYQRGYFREQNLDVQLVFTQDPGQLAGELAAGRLDAAAPPPGAELFQAIASGSRLRVILPLAGLSGRNCAAAGFVARSADIRSGRFATAAGWAGARVALPPGGADGLPGYLLAQQLAAAGLGVADIALPQLDLPGLEGALPGGQADIVYAAEPGITRLTADSANGLLIAAGQLAPGLPSGLVVVGKRLLDDPALGKRFARAYLEAAAEFAQGPTPRNQQLAGQLTRLPQALLTRVCWPLASADGTLELPPLLSFERWLVSRGLLTRVLDASEFYEPALVKP